MRLTRGALLLALSIVGAHASGELPSYERLFVRPNAELATPVVPRLTFSYDGQEAAALSAETADATARVVLFSLANRQVRYAFSSHTGSMSAVAFHPFQPLLAIGATDGQIIFWDTDTLRQVGRLTGHQGKINSLQFSPWSPQLVSASDDGTAILWDIGSQRMQRRLSGHRAPVLAAEVMGTERVVTASTDGTVRLHDALSGTELQTLRLPGRSTPNSLATTFRTDIIAVGTTDGEIQTWSITGTPLRTMKGHKAAVESLTISPDGRLIASVGRDGRMIFWNLTSGLILDQVSAASFPIYDVQFSPDGDDLLTASSDNTIRLWNVVTRSERMRFVVEEANSRSTVPDWMTD